MKSALLVVDIQNDYFPGGRMELVGSLAAAQQAGRLLAHFRAKQEPLVFIQHIATRPGATFFLPGSVGAEIHPSVSPQEGEPVIQKHFPNSFRETGLLEHLRRQEIDTLVICGMMTHMCIDATTRAAFDLGFACQVAGDACATRDLRFEDQIVPAGQVHAAFLAALHGTYARVLKTADVFSDLK